MKRVLFIGLVDLEKIRGDSLHFGKLLNFMNNYFEVSVLSLTKKYDSRHVRMKYPMKKILRVVYWNMFIFFVIAKRLIFNKIDAVYFRESGLVLSPYLARVIFGGKLFVEINGVNIDDVKLSKKITLPLFEKLYNIPDLFIASRGYGDLIKFDFNVKPTSVHTVSLGYDFNTAKLDVVPEKFDIKTIVFIGNLAAYQGLDLFLEALFLYVIERKNSANFLIIGDGLELNHLTRKVERLKLGNHVKFIPPLINNELSSLLKRCHLGISTFKPNRGKRNTISALKTFDYINSRLPILTSDMDEMANFISSHSIGDVICDYTAEECCEKLANCLSDSFLSKSRQQYQHNFDTWAIDFAWSTRFESIKDKIKEV